jgi:hypothetical protein
MLLDMYRHAEWLVIYFEGPVLDRENSERRAKHWKTITSIGEKRRRAWLESALSLVMDHPLAEITETVDWIFEKCKGWLPASIQDEQLRNKDRKVTRLRLIFNYYADIRKAMATGNGDILVPAPQQRRKGAGQQQPKQSEVDELVAQFAEFRSSIGDRHISEFRIANWAKSFRILLVKHPFDDIKAVIETIRDGAEIIDQQRYHDAYDLNSRAGEWKFLMSMVPLRELIKAEKPAEPQVVGAPGADDHRRYEAGDDDWYPTRARYDEDDDDRKVTRTDMSDHEERLARYGAGRPSVPR